MTVQTTLKKALAASDQEYIDGFRVESYHYPTDFDGTVVLNDADDCAFELDLQQQVTFQDGHAVAVRDVNGNTHHMVFQVIRPLRQEDLR